MKILYLIVILTLISINGISQTIRLDTYLESSPVSLHNYENPQSEIIENLSYLEKVNFEQKLMWRKRYNAKGKEKDGYWFHSAYVVDSMVGVKFIGTDINMIHETFSSHRWNHFRQWNCLRLGAALSVEYNPFSLSAQTVEFHKYLNFNIYVDYLHNSKTSRGDTKTQYRKNSWGLKSYYDLKKRIFIDFKYKPSKILWVHLRYKRSIYDFEYYSFTLEWELNPNGYSNCKVENTRDIYKGLSIFSGIEYNKTNESYLFNVGLHFSYLNH